MKTYLKPVMALSAVAVLCGTLLPAAQVAAGDKPKSAIEEGKELTFDRKKGNCLACHRIEGGTAPGNIAPPLLVMSKRFPDKAKLREQIADATAKNPNSMMPPFGRHKILSDEEIDKITEYVYSL